MERDNNPRGQVSLVVGAQRYTLRFDWNAIADAEEQLGKPFYELFQRLADGKFGAHELRVFLWAGLRKQHADVTLPQAGELLDELDFGETAELVIGAVSAAFSKRASSGNVRAAAGAGTRS